MRGDQNRNDAGAEHGTEAGGKSRQQRDQIDRHQEINRPLDDPAPGRRDEKMPLQEGRDRMRLKLDGRHSRTHRRHEYAADPGSGRSDQHDLVAVLFQRDLAARHVVERVLLNGRPAVPVLVEIREHLHRRIRAHPEIADLQRFTRTDLDVLGSQIEASCDDHDRERRVVFIVIGDGERFGADRSVHVGDRVQMPHCGRGGAQTVYDRDFDGAGEERKIAAAALDRERVLAHEFGKGLVGLATRLAEREQQRQHHVARLGETLGELPVGVECALGFPQRRADLKQLRRYAAGRLARICAHRHQPLVGLEKPVDVGQARIELRLGEKNRVADDFGLRVREAFDHLCMDLARPRPATDIVDAALVDRDHGNLVGRGSRRSSDAPIVSEALEGLDQLGPAGREHHERYPQTQKPVFFPEARFGHGLSRLFLLLFNEGGAPSARILRQPPLTHEEQQVTE